MEKSATKEVIATCTRAPLRSATIGFSTAVVPAGAEDQQNRPGDHEHAAPDQVDVQSERSRVDRLITEQAVAGEQQPHQSQHGADRQADIERHQKNTTFRSTVAARTIVASVTGRRYQAIRSSRGFAVSECTSPTSSRSSRGRVTSDTATVTAKHAENA